MSRDQLWELPDLMLAVSFAAAQVNRRLKNQRQVRPLLAKAATLRELLLSGLESAASAGLVPAAAVEHVRRGRGPVDAAQDCVDAAALFRKHAGVLEGKTPVTEAKVAEAALVGTQLLSLLRPARALPVDDTPAETRTAVSHRDRLFTLLVRRHEDLWRAGAYLFGKAVDDHVPALQSHAGRPRKKAAVQPAPAVTTTTAPA